MKEAETEESYFDKEKYALLEQILIRGYLRSATGSELDLVSLDQSYDCARLDE